MCCSGGAVRVSQCVRAREGVRVRACIRTRARGVALKESTSNRSVKKKKKTPKDLKTAFDCNNQPP